AVELLTAGPAGAFGLPGGHLGPGAPADVTLVDPGAEGTVEAARFPSKSRDTPVEGRKGTGRGVRTGGGGRTGWPLEERRGRGEPPWLWQTGRRSRATPSAPPERRWARWCSTPR